MARRSTATRYVTGDKLRDVDQLYVRAVYVHRYTGDHIPKWVYGKGRGAAVTLQFANDADWLAHTEFAVRKDGHLDGRVHHCESHPTWPNGQGARTFGGHEDQED